MSNLKEILNEIDASQSTIKSIDIFRCEEHPDYGRNSAKSKTNFKGMKNSIKKNFDIRLFQIPTVMDVSVETNSESYEVIDGNNRINALKELLLEDGISSYEMQVRVLNYDTMSERAKLFVKLNTELKPVQANDKFKAWYTAGERLWKEMVKDVEKHGFQIKAIHGTSKMTPYFEGVTALYCAKGLTATKKAEDSMPIHNPDEDVFDETFSSLNAWKHYGAKERQFGASHIVVNSIAKFHKLARRIHFKLDREYFMGKLHDTSPTALMNGLQGGRASKRNPSINKIKLDDRTMTIKGTDSWRMDFYNEGTRRKMTYLTTV